MILPSVAKNGSCKNGTAAVMFWLVRMMPKIKTVPATDRYISGCTIDLENTSKEPFSLLAITLLSFPSRRRQRSAAPQTRLRPRR